MARRYHQGRKDRMDESLGERRGKESTEKQSYKSRRHESEGMHRAMSRHHNHDEHHEHHEDHPSRHMGHGEFANMPRHEIFHAYPKEKYGYGDYNDTIHGIDEVETESYRKVEHHRTSQK